MIFDPTHSVKFTKKFTKFLTSLENLKEMNVNAKRNPKDIESIKDYSLASTLCNQIFKDLNNISLENSLYWDLCNLDVYKKTFNKRLNEFVNTNVDSNKGNFIETEILNCVDTYNSILKEYSFSGAALLLKNRLNYLKSLQNSNKFSYKNPERPKVWFDPKLWNENCFNFFEYLIENYYTKHKRQLTDIWHFLKKDLNEEGFMFLATQEEYSSFIKSYMDIELKNWQQSNFKYEETEKKRLKSFFDKYKTT